MKASVIIPVYNGEKTLRQCLDSVLDQGYGNYEVIVVDNNSTDSTKNIIGEFMIKDERVRYIFERTRKRGAARNTGERIAKGEIIVMTDSDCIVYPNWLKEITKPIIDKECDAVQGSSDNIKNDFWSKQVQLHDSRNIQESFFTENAIGRIDTKNFAISGEVLRRIGFTSRKYFSGNDTDISIRFQKQNLKLKVMPIVRIKHFHIDSFKKAVNKYFYRAVWCAIITNDHYWYLKKTNFLEDTNQTYWSFFKFFFGLPRTFVLDGPKYAYYNLVTGLAWRAGLIYGWLR